MRLSYPLCRLRPVSLIPDFWNIYAYVLTGHRAAAVEVVSTVSSVASMLQVSDPTQSGIFNEGPVTHGQDYKQMYS